MEWREKRRREVRDVGSAMWTWRARVVLLLSPRVRGPSPRPRKTAKQGTASSVDQEGGGTILVSKADMFRKNAAAPIFTRADEMALAIRRSSYATSP